MKIWVHSLPLALLLFAPGYAARPEPGVEASDLPEIANHSSEDWKIKLKGRAGGNSGPEIGSIQIKDLRDGKKVLHNLASAKDEFILKAGSRYKIHYLDAPNGLLTRASERIHTVTFYLVDSGGRKLELISERSECPLSTVFVRAIVATPLKPAAQAAFHPNEFEPGNLTIQVGAVPARMDAVE
jgi:hypothetical protein